LKHHTSLTANVTIIYDMYVLDVTMPVVRVPIVQKFGIIPHPRHQEQLAEKNVTSSKSSIWRFCSSLHSFFGVFSPPIQLQTGCLLDWFNQF